MLPADLGCGSGRREFIGLLGGAAVAWPLAVRAQQPLMPVVGFLSGRSPTDFVATVAAFNRRGLNECRLFRRAECRDRLPLGARPLRSIGAALAADLICRKVTVIVATGGGVTSAQAAKARDRHYPDRLCRRYRSGPANGPRCQPQQSRRQFDGC